MAEGKKGRQKGNIPEELPGSGYSSASSDGCHGHGHGGIPFLYSEHDSCNI